MKPNILLIICDTLRKDVLQLYGGEAKTSNLNRLAKDSMIYENAIAPSPWTFPSHVSLFTGLYAGEHMVHEVERLDVLDIIKRNESLRVMRLSERLLEMGYNTSGISNNAWISSQTGFGAGFRSLFLLDMLPKWVTGKIAEAERYGTSLAAVLGNLIKKGELNKLSEFSDAWRMKKRLDKAFNYPLDKGSSLTYNILFNREWGERLFTFLNFVEVHEPYEGETIKERWEVMLGLREQTEERAAFIKMQYIKETEYLDRRIGEIIEILKDRGLYDDTMIIITSDHGQAFNEHGFMYHGIYLYDEIVRIPLIVKYPNSRKFKRRKGYQSLVNIWKLIESIIGGEDDSPLTTRVAFSESFGFSHKVPIRYEKTVKNIRADYTKTRIAVYKDNFKLTFNVTDQKVEELLKNGAKIDAEKNKIKANELLKEYKAAMGNRG